MERDENVDKTTDKNQSKLLEKTIENSLNFTLDATANTDTSQERHSITTTSNSNISSDPSTPSSPISPLSTSQVDETQSHKKIEDSNSSITKSTVVITDSQILDFNNANSDKFVEVGENESKDTQDSNDLASMMIKSQNEETSLNDVSVAKEEEEEIEQVDEDKFEGGDNENMNSNGFLQEANLIGSSEHLSDDYEKEYEITNMDNLQKGEITASELGGKEDESNLETFLNIIYLVKLYSNLEVEGIGYT